MVLFTTLHARQVTTEELKQLQTPLAVLSIRAGSRPKQPASGQSLAGYFRLTLLLILH